MASAKLAREAFDLAGHQLPILGEHIVAIIGMREFECEMRLAFLGGKAERILQSGTDIFQTAISRCDRDDVLCMLCQGQKAPFTDTLRTVARASFSHFERQDRQTDDSGWAFEGLHIDLESARGTIGLLEHKRFVMIGLTLEGVRKHLWLQQQGGCQHQRGATHRAAGDLAGRAYRPGVGIGDLKIRVQDQHVIGQLINGSFQVRLRRRRRKGQHHQMLTGA